MLTHMFIIPSINFRPTCCFIYLYTLYLYSNCSILNCY